MKEARKGRRFLWDAILISVLLLLALASILVLLLTRDRGGVVEVSVDGRTVATYALDRDGEYSLGDGSNILVIEDGAAYMRWADCPDGTCVGVGRIRYNGQSIVCLPNRICVIVKGADGDVDLVSR